MMSLKTAQKKLMIEQNKKIIQQQKTKKNDLEIVRQTKTLESFQHLRVSLTGANESYIKEFLSEGGLQTMLDVVSETVKKDMFFSYYYQDYNYLLLQNSAG
jgi:hypothetical protein